MRTVERGTTVRYQLGLRSWQRHLVVMLLLQRWEGSRLSISPAGLHLLLLLFTALGGLHDLLRAVLIRGVIEQRANVVHE